MRKQIALLAFILVAFTGQAQQNIEYKVLSDNPDAISTNFLYLYYFDYQGGFLNSPDERHNATGSLGSSVDLWQEAGPVIANANFKLGYSGDAAEFKRMHIRFDGGVAYPLGSRTAVKEAKVNVALFKTVVTVEDEHGGILGFADAVGVQQILVPATYKYNKYLRGGLAFQNGTYDRNRLGIGTYKSVGIYAGIARESRVHVVTQLLNRKALSSQYIRMYFDGFFYPVLSTDVDPEGKKSPFGFRAGMQGSFPGMNNFINWMTPKVEIGFHGYHGSYFTVGFGVDLYHL
jgi:hypothetical protein